MAVKVENKDVKRGIKVYLDGKEVAANATAIRAKMKEIEKELKNMAIGSEEYRRKVKDWEKLNGILKEHKANLRAIAKQQETVEGGFKSMWKRGAEFFSKYSLQIGGAIAAITGVAMQLQRFRKQAAEQEDAAANLKALTGLSDENIQWLTKQAETLSTTMEKSGLRVRKSATEILEAYMLVGSKKPELLQDKEALNAVTIEAMRLAEAAKMELKDAVAGVTLAMNQYGASAEEAARYVNVLAAGSKFGAVGVATQTESIVKAGVAANMAKVPIEQLVGVLETLGERGIEGQIAGTQLKTFFLRLEAGAKDTRPSVVGLQQALENLAAKNLDVTQLTKMFGMESISTAQALISSADKVKYYTDAVTGTSTAIEQARINSDTTAAKMAQVRNQINLTGQELAKTLAPVMSKTVGWTRKFVMMLPGIIDFLKEWGVQLLVLAAAYNALAIKNALATAAQKGWNAAVSLGKGIAGGFRAMLLLLHAGYTLLTKGLAAAKIEMMAFNAAMAANAFGIIITAGVLLYEVITRLINRTKQLTKEQKLQYDMQRDIAEAEREGNSQRAEAETKIKQLSAVVHDNNRTLKDRKIALQELKKIVPGYHAELTTEGKLIKDNTTALKDYLDNLKEVAVQQALQSKMTKLVEAELNQQDSRIRRANAERIRRDRLSAFDAEHEDIKRFMEKGLSMSYGGGYEFVSEWMKKNDVGRMTAQRQIGELMQQRAHILETIREAEGWVSEADDAIENIQKRQENLQKQGADIVKTLPGSTGSTEPTVEPEPTKTPETESEKEKRIREAIEAVNTEYDARANELKQKYLAGEIASELEYSQQLEALEMERLNRQLEIAGLEPKQREQLQSRLLDIKMKLMEQLKELDGLELDEEQAKLQKMLRQNEDAYNRRNAIIAKAVAAGILTEEEAAKRRQDNETKRRKDDQKAEEEAASQRLKVSRKGLDAALQQLRQARAEEGMTEETYNAQVHQAQLAYYEKALEDQKLSKEDREALERERAEAQLAITEENNKKIEDSNRQLFDALRSAGDDLGQALAEWLTDANTSFKEFSKELLKTIVKTVENIMTAAIVQRTVENIRTLGFWGIAKAAGEIALIKTAGAALNGLISNFYTGGYTGQGRWDEPRGVVHAGEFVANRHAVASPVIRPVLDLINQAQQSGNIANLTAADIAAVATAHTGSHSAAPTHPASTPVTPAPGTARDPELTRAIQLLIRTTVRAAEAYSEPSPAICYLEGPGGINTAQHLLDLIKNNASRK